NDNAGNAPYTSGSFNGMNGGGGFMPWQIVTSGTAGAFTAPSSIGSKAWGLYANGGSATALRQFAPLAVGNTISFQFDNGGVDNPGSRVGVRVANNAGQLLTEFRFSQGA